MARGTPKTPKPPKTLISAMAAFEKAVRGPLENMQDDYVAVLHDKPVDRKEASNLAGQLYVIMMYDRFFDHVRETYGFVDKALVQSQLGVKLSQEDFDEWIADNVDWFTEELYLPDRARDFPVLMQKMDDTMRAMMQLDNFIKLGLNNAATEFKNPDLEKFTEGMKARLDWVAATVVPEIVPDAPAPTQSAQAVTFKFPAPGMC